MVRPISRNTHLPVEIFGYVPDDKSLAAQMIRSERRCPFVDAPCIKKPYRTSKLANGSCTVSHLGEPNVICPLRFLENGRSALLTEAAHYLGTEGKIVLIPEISLGRNIGRMDWIAARLGPSGNVEDFIGIEIMANQTTSTGPLTDALQEFENTGEFSKSHYGYGLNTYMQVKTFFTQALVKGNIFEAWGKTLVWVMQDALFDNWMKRINLKLSSTQNGSYIAFAILSLVHDAASNRYGFTLRERRFITYGKIAEVYSNQDPPDIKAFVSEIEGKINGKGI
jgi:hypothetical protein